MKKNLKILVAAVFLVAVTASFFGVPYVGWACRVQPAAAWAFLVVLLLTPLVGRFFCETMCPLGILQTLVNKLFHPRRHVRRVCTRLPVSKGQWAVRLVVLVAAVALVALGFGGLGWSLTPYSIYGKALTGSLVGIALAGAILVAAIFVQGRLWCNWVCPAGTLFTLLAKKSVCAHKVGPGCANCRRCFPKAEGGAHGVSALPAESGHAGRVTLPEAPDTVAVGSRVPRDRVADGVTRRETLQGVAVIAAAAALEKTTDGGYAPVSLPGVPERAARVLPPGAGSRAAFNRLCVGCGRCLTVCPAHVLRASTRLSTFGQPEMDFRGGPCLVGCDYKCARACPVEALDLRRLTADGGPAGRVTLPHKDVHVGFAVWHKDLCLRTTEDVPCTACVRKCPVKAIHLVEGFPVVDREACIGCGACEHVCPVRPLPAIEVQGLEVQRVVRPVESRE